MFTSGDWKSGMDNTEGKLLAKVYYQDFELNALNFVKPQIVDKDKATFIVQFCFDPAKNSREEFCDKCFEHMNFLNVPPEHPDRPLFEKAGHTSMSVGDYVEFQDGEILVCAKAGWENISSRVTS
jgi:hypothetical protein